MPCLLLVVILAFPRVVLALMFFFSNYLERAYHGVLVPLLGFMFLPVTTVVYAWMVNNGLPLAGLNLIWILLAVLIDLGSFGGGYSRRRYR
ncbi:MAG: hypothetical protein ACR2NN_28565 [Bryobacteraceae bacterium]